MVHKLIEIERVERYALPFDVSAALPVSLISLADPDAPSYAYRWLCACDLVGVWVVSSEKATDGWITHVCGPEVQEAEAERDEIVRLAEQLGAKIGMSGIAWLRGLTELDEAHPALTAPGSCADCGRTDDQIITEGHDVSCFYYVVPEPK